MNITEPSFWQKQKTNFILIGLILAMASLVLFAVQRGGLLQTSLINTEVVFDLQMTATSIHAKSVDLTWSKDSSTGTFPYTIETSTFVDDMFTGTKYYTEEVKYDVRFYTGEVQTDQLLTMWNEFDPISYESSGILVESDNVKQITALKLRPDTLYTFAVMENNHQLHMSNALQIRTIPLQQDGEEVKGDMTMNGDIDQWDAYVLSMYLFYKNWSAFLVAMNTQGIALPPLLVESKFKEIADIDGNCSIDFEDVSIITQISTGKRKQGPVSQSIDCVY